MCFPTIITMSADVVTIHDSEKSFIFFFNVPFFHPSRLNVEYNRLLYIINFLNSVLKEAKEKGKI
jgi:hypothetical protein